MITTDQKDEGNTYLSPKVTKFVKFLDPKLLDGSPGYPRLSIAHATVPVANIRRERGFMSLVAALDAALTLRRGCDPVTE